MLARAIREHRAAVSPALILSLKAVALKASGRCHKTVGFRLRAPPKGRLASATYKVFGRKPALGTRGRGARTSTLIGQSVVGCHQKKFLLKFARDRRIAKSCQAIAAADICQEREQSDSRGLQHGHRLHEIAALLGVHYATVSRRLKKIEQAG